MDFNINIVNGVVTCGGSRDLRDCQCGCVGQLYNPLNRKYSCQSCSSEDKSYKLIEYSYSCSDCNRKDRNTLWFAHSNTKNKYCFDCKNNHPYVIEVNVLTYRNNNYGSVRDWIPIYDIMGNDDCQILLNINKDSPYYHNCGVSVCIAHINVYNLGQSVDAIHDELSNYLENNLEEQPFLNFLEQKGCQVTSE